MRHKLPVPNLAFGLGAAVLLASCQDHTAPTALSAPDESVVATASSGELVPSATTVSPTTSGEIPNAQASRDVPGERLPEFGGPEVLTLGKNTVSEGEHGRIRWRDWLQNHNAL